MYIPKLPLTLITLSLLGFGCTTTTPKITAPETALTICDKKPYASEFSKIFGDKNYPATDNSSYADDFRNTSNTCVYTGFVASNNRNYFFAVSTVSDKDKKFFTWKKEHVESPGTEVIAVTDASLPTGSFYKKVTILDQINFGDTRKEQTSWDLIVHSGDVTYAVSDVPQFADMTEAQVKIILGSVVQNLLKK